MSRPRLLDLFSCAGGAGMGYSRAGFEVVGVDIEPQPRYPFEFIQRDAIEALRDEEFLASFDAIHASPPCQAYTKAQRIMQNDHPDLIGEVRRLLKAIGKPWVIENVEGAPLVWPIRLCGASFGLRTYRHRLFESSVVLVEPRHVEHQWAIRKMGRKPKPGEFMHVVGHFTDVEYAKQVMGIDWMTRDELREAIPPAFTQWIGLQLLTYVELAA